MEVLDLQKKVYIRNGAKYSKVSAFWYLLVQCSVCGQITIYNSQCMANLTLCSDMNQLCSLTASPVVQVLLILLLDIFWGQLLCCNLTTATSTPHSLIWLL